MSAANATVNTVKGEGQINDVSPKKRVQVVYAQPLPPALTSDSIRVTQVTQKTSQQAVSYESLEVGQLFSRTCDGACVYLKVSKSKAVALDDAADEDITRPTDRIESLSSLDGDVLAVGLGNCV